MKKFNDYLINALNEDNKETEKKSENKQISFEKFLEEKENEINYLTYFIKHADFRRKSENFTIDPDIWFRWYKLEEGEFTIKTNNYIEYIKLDEKEKYEKSLNKFLNTFSKNELISIEDEFKDNEIQLSAYNFCLNKIKNKVQNTDETLELKDKNDFEDLGKAVTYRAALAFSVTDAKYTPENIISCCKDLFKSDSDGRISMFTNLTTVLREAAARATLKELDEKKGKSEKFTNFVKSSKELLENPNATANDVDKTCNEISKSFPDVYKKHYDLFQQAIEQGIKEQKEDMAKDDYEWVDPITGVKAKGIKKTLQKFNHVMGKKIEDQFNKMNDKIKGLNHTLENDILKLGNLVFRGVFNGIRTLKKWINDKKFNYNTTHGLMNPKKFKEQNKNSEKESKEALDKLEKLLKNTDKKILDDLVKNTNNGFYNKPEEKQKQQHNQEQPKPEQSSAPQQNSSVQMTYNNMLNEAEEQSTDPQYILDQIKETTYKILNNNNVNVAKFYNATLGENELIGNIGKNENDEPTFKFNMVGNVSVLENINFSYKKALKLSVRLHKILETYVSELDEKIKIINIMLNTSSFKNHNDELKNLDKSLLSDKFKEAVKNNKDIITELEKIKTFYSNINPETVNNETTLVEFDTKTLNKNLGTYLNDCETILNHMNKIKFLGLKGKTFIIKLNDVIKNKMYPVSFGKPIDFKEDNKNVEEIIKKKLEDKHKKLEDLSDDEKNAMLNDLTANDNLPEADVKKVLGIEESYSKLKNFQSFIKSKII